MGVSVRASMMLKKSAWMGIETSPCDPSMFPAGSEVAEILSVAGVKAGASAVVATRTLKSPLALTVCDVLLVARTRVEGAIVMTAHGGCDPSMFPAGSGWAESVSVAGVKAGASAVGASGTLKSPLALTVCAVLLVASGDFKVL